MESARRDGDTLGGVVGSSCTGSPPGLGSHALGPPARPRLAGALMGIQAIKGVEVGDGFDSARVAEGAGRDPPGPGRRGAASGRSGGTGGRYVDRRGAAGAPP